jgi:hypothetical protein
MGTPSRLNAVLTGVIVFALSAAFAIAGMIVLARLADARNWCCVHSWALAHGTGLPVLLCFGFIGYHLVRYVGTRLGWLDRRSANRGV